MERIRITQGDKTASEVFIGDGVATSAELVMPPRSGRRRVAILTQPGSRDTAGALEEVLRGGDQEVALRTLPDRDKAKTLVVVEETYLWLNSLGITRHDTIVAVGGGAATDVGGFVGATYLRGIETVLAPTTLLGAVDAAIGGKTAVNVGGKNLAGVFSHPARVIIDTAVLAELPEELLIEGTAEAVKAGFIADPDLVALYEADGLAAPLAEVVRRAVRVKSEVVSADFTEQGRRAILNYGHTVGHAVEFVSGIPHGHAVAIGMVAAGKAAELLTGFESAAAQRELLAKLRLPVDVADVDREAVEAALLLDKKRDSTGVRMVLLEAFGKPTVMTVDMTTVRAALCAVGVC
ncbi:3-dehydroquinate synthase family protein [Actinomycetota bacterium]